MAFALQQGARQLLTYEHPFLESFFLRFGFRARDRVHLAQLQDAPPSG
jgi:hypothetical protein